MYLSSAASISSCLQFGRSSMNGRAAITCNRAGLVSTIGNNKTKIIPFFSVPVDLSPFPKTNPLLHTTQPNALVWAICLRMPDNVDQQETSGYNDSRSDCPSARGGTTVMSTKTSFIHKLYYMLEDDSMKHLIWWLPGGLSFAVVPNEDFSKALSHYFKHTNIASFVRQLNMYGFHKVNENSSSNSTNNGSTAPLDAVSQTEQARSRNSSTSSNPNGLPIWEFRHSSGFFQQGNPEDLKLIKRRSRQPKDGYQRGKDNLDIGSESTAATPAPTAAPSGPSAPAGTAQFSATMDVPAGPNGSNGSNAPTSQSHVTTLNPMTGSNPGVQSYTPQHYTLNSPSNTESHDEGHMTAQTADPNSLNDNSAPKRFGNDNTTAKLEANDSILSKYNDLNNKFIEFKKNYDILQYKYDLALEEMKKSNFDMINLINFMKESIGARTTFIRTQQSQQFDNEKHLEVELDSFKKSILEKSNKRDLELRDNIAKISPPMIPPVSQQGYQAHPNQMQYHPCHQQVPQQAYHQPNLTNAYHHQQQQQQQQQFPHAVTQPPQLPLPQEIRFSSVSSSSKKSRNYSVMDPLHRTSEPGPQGVAKPFVDTQRATTPGSPQMKQHAPVHSFSPVPPQMAGSHVGPIPQINAVSESRPQPYPHQNFDHSHDGELKKYISGNSLPRGSLSSVSSHSLGNNFSAGTVTTLMEDSQVETKRPSYSLVNPPRSIPEYELANNNRQRLPSASSLTNIINITSNSTFKDKYRVPGTRHNSDYQYQRQQSIGSPGYPRLTDDNKRSLLTNEEEGESRKQQRSVMDTK